MGKFYFHLTFVRHARSKHNELRVIQGQYDSPLSEAGINQAKALGEILQNLPIHQVVSSDLLRAFQTGAEIIAQNKLGKGANLNENDYNSNNINNNSNGQKNVHGDELTSELICKSELLRERDFGVLSLYPLVDMEKISEYASHDRTWQPENGESITHVMQRCDLFMHSICRKMALAEQPIPIKCPIIPLAIANNKRAFPPKSNDLPFSSACNTTNCQQIWLKQNHEYKGNALIISHGGFINHFIHEIHEKGLLVLDLLDNSSNLKKFPRIPNCSIIQFTVVCDHDDATSFDNVKWNSKNCQIHCYQINGEALLTPLDFVPIV